MCNFGHCGPTPTLCRACDWGTFEHWRWRQIYHLQQVLAECAGNSSENSARSVSTSIPKKPPDTRVAYNANPHVRQGRQIHHHDRRTAIAYELRARTVAITGRACSTVAIIRITKGSQISRFFATFMLDLGTYIHWHIRF